MSYWTWNGALEKSYTIFGDIGSPLLTHIVTVAEYTIHTYVTQGVEISVIVLTILNTYLLTCLPILNTYLLKRDLHETQKET